jgi:hypothetical protein
LGENLRDFLFSAYWYLIIFFISILLLFGHFHGSGVPKQVLQNEGQNEILSAESAIF